MATAYERVRIARGAKRPTGMDYLQNVFHGFFELHGDRRYADDPAIVGGLAYLGATPVTVIAIEKGHTAKERVQRGFGAPQPEGYRKALRLMRQAEKFHRPVVCFVDTSGAGCNVGAEERGQGEAIAECLTTMSALQTPVLSILIGEGGSGGALALAAGDRVWMLENAVYSVISPEGCATILWKDAAKAEQAAEELKLTADDALALGVVESVIPEAGLGEPEFYDALSQRLMREVDALTEMPIQELLSARYARFRRFGGEAQRRTGRPIAAACSITRPTGWASSIIPTISVGLKRRGRTFSGTTASSIPIWSRAAS